MLLFCIFLCVSSCFETKTAKREAVSVETLKVQSRADIRTSNYVGTVVEGKSATVYSPSQGNLKLYVKKGQEVTKGQKIAFVNSQTAKSSFEIAKAKYEQAKDAYNRVLKVKASGSVTELKFVEVKTSLSQAKAAYEAAEKALDDCLVTAPFDGIVEDVFVEEGIEASIAQRIARIIDISFLEIHFPLPESEFSSLQKGDLLTVVVPAIGKEFQAPLTGKGVVASSLSHSYDCTIILKAEGLMPGMACKIYNDVRASEGRIAIPSTCILTDGEGRYVWTVREGIVYKTYIRTGEYSGNAVVVTAGLSEGDVIVVKGSRKVSSGMSVKSE